MTYGEYLGAGSSTTKLLLHLNGNSTDSSGNGSNGTDTNITYSLANGKFGQGASFNGSSSITYTGYDMNNTTEFTLSMMVKIQNTTGYRMLWINRGSTKTPYIAWNGTALEFLWYTSSGSNLLTCTDLVSGVYANIIITYKSGEQKIYINGVLSNTYTGLTGNISIDGNSPRIGMNNTTQYFIGKMDEVIIENVARSAEKVKKYYSYARGRYAIL